VREARDAGSDRVDDENSRVSSNEKIYNTESWAKDAKIDQKEQKMQVVCNMDAARSCAATETPKRTLEIILANPLHLQP
jgi:hypothetical protein